MKKKFAFLTCLIAIFLLFMGCEINLSPEAPWWKLDLNLSLIHQVYSAVDLVDSTNIYASDEYLFFFSEGDITGNRINETQLKFSANPEGSNIVDMYVQDDQGDFIPIEIDSDSDDSMIVSATVLDGKLDFDIKNLNTQVDSIYVIFRGLTDPDDQQLIVRIPNIGVNFIWEHDLRDHKFIDADEEDAILEEIEFTVDYVLKTSLPSGTYLGQMRAFYAEDIYFSTIRGYVNNMVIDVQDSDNLIELQYPENIENALNLNDPKLYLELHNHVGFESLFSGTITAYNTRVSPVKEAYVRIENYPIAAATETMNPMMTAHVFEVGDPYIVEGDMAQLINIAPDEIKLTEAKFTIDSYIEGAADQEPGFASVGPSFDGHYETIVPFDFTFDPDEPFRPDELTEVEVDEKNRELIEKRVDDIQIVVKIENYFDMGANVSLYFASTSNRDSLYVNEDVESDNFNRMVFTNISVSRQINNEPGKATIVFDVPRVKLPIFYRYEDIYCGLEIDFHDGTAVITPDQRVVVKSHLQARVKAEFGGM